MLKRILHLYLSDSLTDRDETVKSVAVLSEATRVGSAFRFNNCGFLRNYVAYRLTSGITEQLPYPPYPPYPPIVLTGPEGPCNSAPRNKYHHCDQ